MMFAPKKERKDWTWISFIKCLKCYDISIQHVRVGLQKCQITSRIQDLKSCIVLKKIII